MTQDQIHVLTILIINNPIRNAQISAINLGRRVLVETRWELTFTPAAAESVFNLFESNTKMKIPLEATMLPGDSINIYDLHS